VNTHLKNKITRDNAALFWSGLAEIQFVNLITEKVFTTKFAPLAVLIVAKSK